MRAFEHVNATTSREAILLLGADPAARPLAGGTDLIPVIRQGIRDPDRLVNLKTIPDLDAIAAQDGRLRIGALVRLGDVATHPLIRSTLPILADAVEQAASAQIRNQATLGGSLCQESRCWYYRGPFHCWLKGGDRCDAEHGDNRHHAILGGGPCFTIHPSDTATALVALDGRVVVDGPSGEREVSLDQFFTRPRDGHRALTSLGAGEIVTFVDVPWPTASARGAFLKAMERAEFGFALASVACVVRLDGDVVTAARIVLGGVAPIPWRATKAEKEIIGRRLDAATIRRASQATTDGARSLAMNGYKVDLTRALVKRCLGAVASGDST